MGKRIIAVNAGPRKGWNTDTLINEAVRGAEQEGAEVVRYDLYKLERFTNCIPCGFRLSSRYRQLFLSRRNHKIGQEGKRT